MSAELLGCRGTRAADALDEAPPPARVVTRLCELFNQNGRFRVEMIKRDRTLSRFCLLPLVPATSMGVRPRLSGTRGSAFTSSSACRETWGPLARVLMPCRDMASVVCYRVVQV
jgi:hypothetical protein